MSAPTPGLGGSLPRIRGTQKGLRNPGSIDGLKADMLSGRYEFQSPRGQIGGVVDPRGTYHIGEGHHRMVAALEIYRETGDPTYVQLLLQWGLWTEVQRPPVDSRPLPARTWWGAFRNWLGV